MTGRTCWKELNSRAAVDRSISSASRVFAETIPELVITCESLHLISDHFSIKFPEE